MNFYKKLKILSNEMRMEILVWLSDPEKYFPDLADHPSANKEMGVCVGMIERKGHLTQSTISQYMSQLEAAGFVISQKFGKWTHYQRNEEVIKSFLQDMREKLVIDD